MAGGPCSVECAYGARTSCVSRGGAKRLAHAREHLHGHSGLLDEAGDKLGRVLLAARRGGGYDQTSAPSARASEAKAPTVNAAVSSFFFVVILPRRSISPPSPTRAARSAGERAAAGDR